MKFIRIRKTLLKNKTIAFSFLIVLITISACKKDKQKPQTVPTVKTLTATSDQPTTATVTGEISDNGNLTISEAGFAYSSNVDMPTTADNKKTITDFNSFTAELTGLSSGTTYNVRAYAINSKGTSYGEKKSFTTGNAAPAVTNVLITGTLEVGKTVTASYSYADPEDDEEGETIFQWFMADNATGTNETAIAGAITNAFEIQDEQSDKFLRVAITPKALTGTETGSEVKSAFTIQIGAETVTFSYNGSNVTYGTIIGPSGKKWLDRNLGATRVATQFDDYLAYGDMFQWGRAADGHQLVLRTGLNDADVTGINGTTQTTAPYETSDDDTPENNKFIIIAGFSNTGDWRTTPNHNLWQGVDGTNNPCPTGWRIPTLEEWVGENIANTGDAFNKLKLTLTGVRSRSTGAFSFTKTAGMYWTSTRQEEMDDFGRLGSYFIFFDETKFTAEGIDPRAAGRVCRCIKDL